MKVKFFHDGSGNFTGGVTEGMDGTDENQIAGMKLVLTSVAQGFGQAFVFAAGRRGMPVGKCVVTVEGEADMDAFHRDGIDLTVEVQGPGTRWKNWSQKLCRIVFRRVRSSVLCGIQSLKSQGVSCDWYQ